MAVKSKFRFALPSDLDSDDDDGGDKDDDGGDGPSRQKQFKPGQIFAQAKNAQTAEIAGPTSKVSLTNADSAATTTTTKLTTMKTTTTTNSSTKTAMTTNERSDDKTDDKSEAAKAPSTDGGNKASTRNAAAFHKNGTDSSSSSSTSSSASSAAAPGNASGASTTDAANPTSTSASSSSASSSASSRPGTGAKNAMIVNRKQMGNPILKHVTNVAWEYGDIVPDYQVGPTSCVLFLSLRYHNLNPEYIQTRLDALRNMYELRVILVQVDVKDPHVSLKELALMCILANCTLMVAWSPEEAGRYLETYKIYENKPPDALMSRPDGDFAGRMADALTTVKGVNKTDASTLLATFDSLAAIATTDEEKLLLCPGLGPLKAKRLRQLFQMPFTNWK